MHLMSASEPTVYLIDDDRDTRVALQAGIAAMRLAVRAFSSAREFLHKYEPTIPSCLVLDVKMPRLSGIDLYSQMLKDGQRVPVVF